MRIIISEKSIDVLLATVCIMLSLNVSDKFVVDNCVKIVAKFISSLNCR